MKHAELFIKINIISKGGSIPLAVGGMSHPEMLSGTWKDEHTNGTLLFYIQELSFHELGTLRRLWMLRDEGQGQETHLISVRHQDSLREGASLTCLQLPLLTLTKPAPSSPFVFFVPPNTPSPISFFFVVVLRQSLAQTGFILF